MKQKKGKGELVLVLIPYAFSSFSWGFLRWTWRKLLYLCWTDRMLRYKFYTTWYILILLRAFEKLHWWQALVHCSFLTGTCGLGWKTYLFNCLVAIQANFWNQREILINQCFQASTSKTYDNYNPSSLVFFEVSP